MLDLLVPLALALALLPAAMTVANLVSLSAGRQREIGQGLQSSIDILIPARNEEQAISACVEAALASSGVYVRVIVGDDGSTDRTAEIVRRIGMKDGRVCLVTLPALPAGWNGKQHACHALSQRASSPVMLFMDADVRLAPDAVARLAASLEDGRFALVSGVPRQLMIGFWELLLIPMINVLLLGYLPIFRMRQSNAPSLGAGCGQMIMVRRDAYRVADGHAAIRASLHDGLKLPRALRRAGFMTDLVDGARLAECRMYGEGRSLLEGFGKNATEGMATPRALPLWTVLLFGGHVLPWLLLPVAAIAGSPATIAMSALACALPLAARGLQAWRCREPALAILLHPAAVIATLAIQWLALARQLAGGETVWRGRVYRPQS